tara:strand:+ start:510 stop:1391 length:882 start_codon:yes stop_codon:yes gene_type:complete
VKDKVYKYTNSFVNFISNESVQKYLKRINLVFSLFCILFIFRNLSEIKGQESINFEFSLIEVTVMILFYISTGTLWSKFLVSNYGGSFVDYFFNWSYSKIGKYIPSGLMTVSVRLNQTFPKNKNSKKLILGLLEEQFLIPFIGIPALILCLFFENEYQIYGIYSISILVIFLTVKLIYSSSKTEFISMSNQSFLFLFNQIYPLFIYYIIALNLNYENPLQIAVIYLLATYIGLFFIGVPAGIGIREAIFLSIGNIAFDDLYLFSFLIKIRILLIFMDVFFGLLGLFKSNIKKN